MHNYKKKTKLFGSLGLSLSLIVSLFSNITFANETKNSYGMYKLNLNDFFSWIDLIPMTYFIIFVLLVVFLEDTVFSDVKIFKKVRRIFFVILLIIFALKQILT